MDDDKLLAALNGLELRLGERIGSVQAELGARIGSVQAELGARIGSVQAELTTTRSELMGRMDSLSDQIGGIRTDIAVNFAASETVRKANDNTRDEVRLLSETVSHIYRKLLTLEAKFYEGGA